MAKMSGIESTAKIKSVNSITINAINKGVATNKCFFLIKNECLKGNIKRMKVANSKRKKYYS